MSKTLKAVIYCRVIGCSVTDTPLVLWRAVRSAFAFIRFRDESSSAAAIEYEVGPPSPLRAVESIIHLNFVTILRMERSG